jgi:hypothetical protein
MASSTEVVILDAPANNSYQNVTQLDAATKLPRFALRWHGPSTGLPTGGGYELVISDNFAFDDQSPNKVWKFGTTATTFRHDTLQVILEHGNIYYWYVNAVTSLSGESVPEAAERYARSAIRSPSTTCRRCSPTSAPSSTSDRARPRQRVALLVDDLVKNSHLRVRTYCYEEAPSPRATSSRSTSASTTPRT